MHCVHVSYRPEVTIVFLAVPIILRYIAMHMTGRSISDCLTQEQTPRRARSVMLIPQKFVKDHSELNSTGRTVATNQFQTVDVVLQRYFKRASSSAEDCPRLQIRLLHRLHQRSQPASSKLFGVQLLRATQSHDWARLLLLISLLAVYPMCTHMDCKCICMAGAFQTRHVSMTNTWGRNTHGS